MRALISASRSLLVSMCVALRMITQRHKSSPCSWTSVSFDAITIGRLSEIGSAADEVDSLT